VKGAPSGKKADALGENREDEGFRRQRRRLVTRKKAENSSPAKESAPVGRRFRDALPGGGGRKRNRHPEILVLRGGDMCQPATG